MKYFTILFSLLVLVGAGTVKAQSGATINGNSYTFVLNDVNDESFELIDKFTFANNKVASEKYSTARGYSSSNVIEKADGNSSFFEVTLTHPTEGSVKFSGRIVDNSIYGDAVITSNGQQRNVVFRGTTTQVWEDAMQQTTNGQ